MKIGILTRNVKSWCSTQLVSSIIKNNAIPVCFSFRDLITRVGFKPQVSTHVYNILCELDAIIVRPIGRGSLEEIVFRMDVLHRLKRLGMYILNPPSAIEKSVDKFFTLSLLEEAGLPVPRTIAVESANAALKVFHELGEDVVVKPIFGSRGIGSTRVSNKDVAERVFRALEFNHQVIYIQEFVPHGNYDFRIFVLGDRILSSMRRVSENWKTNVSQGAVPEPYYPSHEIADLALKGAKTLECQVAGVDILETNYGPLIIEINSQPGWRGLQSVTKINIADEIIKYVLEKI
ncbi:RimK family alpha-L-glutamate ligase [Candidatus Bathyarchaeota archaeon]|nr:RimK family alpha-L-glutamate ligase [Candidatus Bathyarchaeota archaeon]